MFYGSSRLAAAWLAAAFALPATAEEADRLDSHAGDYTATSNIGRSPVPTEAEED
jgi:hypothetical protein